MLEYELSGSRLANFKNREFENHDLSSESRRHHRVKLVDDDDNDDKYCGRRGLSQYGRDEPLSVQYLDAVLSTCLLEVLVYVSKRRRITRVSLLIIGRFINGDARLRGCCAR